MLDLHIVRAHGNAGRGEGREGRGVWRRGGWGFPCDVVVVGVGNVGTAGITISSQWLREMNVELMIVTRMLLVTIVTVNILK